MFCSLINPNSIFEINDQHRDRKTGSQVSSDVIVKYIAWSLWNKCEWKFLRWFKYGLIFEQYSDLIVNALFYFLAETLELSGQTNRLSEKTKLKSLRSFIVKKKGMKILNINFGLRDITKPRKTYMIQILFYVNNISKYIFDVISVPWLIKMFILINKDIILQSQANHVYVILFAPNGHAAYNMLYRHLRSLWIVRSIVTPH